MRAIRSSSVAHGVRSRQARTRRPCRRRLPTWIVTASGCCARRRRNASSSVMSSPANSSDASVVERAEVARRAGTTAVPLSTGTGGRISSTFFPSVTRSPLLRSDAVDRARAVAATMRSSASAIVHAQRPSLVLEHDAVGAARAAARACARSSRHRLRVARDRRIDGDVAVRVHDLGAVVADRPDALDADHAPRVVRRASGDERDGHARLA